MKVLNFFSLCLVLLLFSNGCEKDNVNETYQVKPPKQVADYWWPVQEEPAKVFIMSHDGSLEQKMLSQSVIGIAAQCVNQGIGDEMIWTDVNNDLHRQIFMNLRNRIGFQISGNSNVWNVVKRYHDEGKITGYILYDLEKTQCIYSDDKNISESANVATMLAGLYRAVMIDRSMEQEARSYGLEMIADATSMTPEQCFSEHKGEFNNLFTFMADPSNPAGRDLVIAQRATMIHRPDQKLYEDVVKWLSPITPVIGVTCADEAETIKMSSKYGHFHIGLDHTDNFTLFSAGAYKVKVDKMTAFDPRSINLESEDKYHSVFVSDGDNLGWIHDYVSTNNRQWLSGDNTSLSWTFSPTSMSEASPYCWNFYVSTKKENCSLLEYGQYFYPDTFAESLPDRRDKLKSIARCLNASMKRTGANILSFICLDSHSEKTYEACQIFVEEIENLLGIVAVQYYPYPDGKGEINWFTNKHGIDIPMIRPKYCIVGGEQGEFAAYQGSPSHIFDLVNADENPLTFSVFHAWSSFTKLPDGELSSMPDPPALGTLEAVSWASRRLEDNVHLVSCEELMWRIRMKFRPDQTKAVLGI